MSTTPILSESCGRVPKIVTLKVEEYVDLHWVLSIRKIHILPVGLLMASTG